MKKILAIVDLDVHLGPAAFRDTNNVKQIQKLTRQRGMQLIRSAAIDQHCLRASQLCNSTGTALLPRHYLIRKMSMYNGDNTIII